MISSKLKNASSNRRGSWAISCEVVEAWTQREPLILIARLFSDDRIISLISSLRISHSPKRYKNFRFGSQFHASLNSAFKAKRSCLSSSSIIENEEMVTSSLGHLAKTLAELAHNNWLAGISSSWRSMIGARVGEGDQRVLFVGGQWSTDPLKHLVGSCQKQFRQVGTNCKEKLFVNRVCCFELLCKAADDEQVFERIREIIAVDIAEGWSSWANWKLVIF
jgi:hypothetical protein